jgi:Mycothiol maleylpyruvate isomerase N-terminal domain.
MTAHNHAPEIDEVGEFIGTLITTPPERLTNCRSWTVHDLTAHLAAGAAEQADLIEERLAGKPERATRTFEEREPVYRALPDAELRERLVAEATRFATAQVELGTGSIAFTGRPMTARDFAMHGRSECTLHRWDIAGQDDIGWAMLGQPALTNHALTVLSTMSALTESPANRAVDLDVPDGLRVIVRSEPHDDLVITMLNGLATLTLEPITDAPAHLVLGPAARLLFLWGRREPSAPITLSATGAPLALLERLIPPSV